MKCFVHRQQMSQTALGFTAPLLAAWQAMLPPQPWTTPSLVLPYASDIPSFAVRDHQTCPVYIYICPASTGQSSTHKFCALQVGKSGYSFPNSDLQRCPQPPPSNASTTSCALTGESPTEEPCPAPRALDLLDSLWTQSLPGQQVTLPLQLVPSYNGG